MADTQVRFRFWRIYATLCFCLLGFAAIEVARQLNNLGVIYSLTTFWWVVVTGTSLLSALGILASWTAWFRRLATRFSVFHRKIWPQKPFILWGIVLALSIGFSLWVLTRGFIVLNGFFSRVFLFILISSISATFLRPLSPSGSWKIALASSMLITAAIFKGLIYILPGISSSPFSLSWSEGSRYYYGSLWFSEKLYGINLPPSPWHSSRYMLMAVPFIFNSAPIWVHRFWQVFMWVGLSGWAGYLLAKRLKITQRMVILAFSAWVFSFLNLGPVYYHLVICVILIYWGVNFDKPGKTLIILLLASGWAGLSRINWIPVPTFLVITLYFLECPWDKTRQGWKYILQPLLWGTGLVSATISYLVYINVSGNLTSKFGSSFTSDLLWNRLWPNSTFQLGILFGVVVASVPLWFVIFFRLRRTLIYRNGIKWFAYAGMALTLFLGGLIVSVKIGGGSNLHNMDAYFVLLMTGTSYLFWGKDVYDQEPSESNRKTALPLWVISLAIFIPILLTVREGWVISKPDPIQDSLDLHKLSQLVADTAEDGGDVLFIAERQLQVFDLIPDIPFIADYEKLELMEMAMSGNSVYLDRFYEDVSNQRFALIISDPIRFDFKDNADAFSEEHNVWVEKVVLPLLKYYNYSPLENHKSINILTPKQ